MENLVGKRYGELTIKEVIKRPDFKKSTKYKSCRSKKWVRCVCRCGNEIAVPFYVVEKGAIKSCGQCGYRARQAAESIMKVRAEHPTPNAVPITYQGETKNIVEWSRKTGIPRTTIMYRLGRGYPLEDVFKRKDLRYAKNNAFADEFDQSD